MEYVSVKEMSGRWCITPRRVQMLCLSGDIPGAVKIGRDWLIPEDACRPDDYRRKEFRHQRSEQV